MSLIFSYRSGVPLVWFASSLWNFLYCCCLQWIFFLAFVYLDRSFFIITFEKSCEKQRYTFFVSVLSWYYSTPFSSIVSDEKSGTICNIDSLWPTCHFSLTTLKFIFHFCFSVIWCWHVPTHFYLYYFTYILLSYICFLITLYLFCLRLVMCLIIFENY